MNTNNTHNGTKGPPATTATADAAAPSPSTVHAPSSSTSTNTNTNCNNPPEDVKVKPTAVEYPPANENEGKAADVSKAFASLPQPILPKPPRPFNVADYDEGEDAKLKSEAKQAMAGASDAAAASSFPQPPKPPRPFNVADYDEGEDAKLKSEAKQAMAGASDAAAASSFPQPPKPPRPFNVADYDEGEDAKFKNEAKQAMADPSGNLSEVVASLPQPQPHRLEPPRPFNVAKFDEGEDAELKNKAKQVDTSKHKESIIVPTEEDMADGATLDPAISRERRTRGDKGEAVDLELGGKVEPLQSEEEEESEEVLQGDVEPYNSELPVLEAYIVEEESRRDIVTATHVEPILPWWKQKRTKLLLSTMFVVFAVMAVALGVSMSSSSTEVMVVRTDAPSKSLVPTSIPSISLRPSVHPSLPPTMTSSPTFTRFESLKLVADDGAEGNTFGGSLAVFGDTLVVGAHLDDDKGEDSGSVCIYNRDPTTKEWIFQQKLVADDGAADDHFGWSVAIFGDTVVVGADGDDNDNGEASGSVYIYNRDLTNKEWIFQQKLVADDGAADDLFGGSVSIYGNTVVVGAYNDDDKGEDSGSAYIYNRDPTTKEWIMQQKLVADDGAANDLFGGSVAVFEDTVVVGAKYDDTDKGEESGLAYIYNRDPKTKEWIMQQKLVAEDGAAGDYFGSSVAVFGDTLVVGAPFDNDKGDAEHYYYYCGSGSAYIYNRDPETKEWIFQQKLVADDGAEYDFFGSSVAIHGDTVVVGADGDDDKGTNSGSAYIYHQDSETKVWILQQKLVADDGAADDLFGGSVAIYNGTVVVGAPEDDTGKGEDSGSVYVYSSSYTRAPTPTPSQSTKPSTTLKPSTIPTQSFKPSTSYSPTETCYWTTVTVVYDDYARETSWEMVSIGSNGIGIVLKSYAELDWVATSHTKDICLIEGEYEFIISDDWGNGLCCGFGKGNYNVTSLGGGMIAQGGEFADEERTRFSIPFTPVQQSPT